MAELPLHRDENTILVQTTSGHALLDPYTTLLGSGVPRLWNIVISNPPPHIPYDGLPSTSHAAPAGKRRKIAREISKNEKANIDLHTELRDWLPKAIEEVRQAWIDSSDSAIWYSTSRIVQPSSSHNALTRVPVDLVAWGRELEEIRTMQAEPEREEDAIIFFDSSSSKRAMSNLYGQVHLNLQENINVVETPAASYLIPPRSGFLVADMTKWHRLLSTFNGADTSFQCGSVGKSVRRSGSYDEMDMYDLYKIRLPELLHTSAEKHPVLIGVWVTNHAKCRGFVHDKLLPSWNISNIVEWYWVKISAGEKGRERETGGLPVWSFDGPSPRRCYEGLMLGCYNPKHLSVKRELPNKRAFLSVPLEHSRKPLVTDLLKPYIQGEEARVLELFARYTAPGTSRARENGGLWFSVGNEPLKYNEVEAHWRAE